MAGLQALLKPNRKKAPRKPGAVRASEASIERTCTDWLKLDGWTIEHTEATYDARRGRGVGQKGMADTLAMRPLSPQLNRTLLTIFVGCQCQVLKIEWKAKGGQLSDAQRMWHIHQRALGFVTLVAGVDFPKSIEGFKAFYRSSGLMQKGI